MKHISSMKSSRCSMRRAACSCSERCPRPNRASKGSTTVIRKTAFGRYLPQHSTLKCRKPFPRRSSSCSHHIALWDVLASCTIAGASDASIRDPKPNDIAQLCAAAPIEQIFCTGAKATQLYRKLCEPAVHLPCEQLPSTSPANAAMKLPDLVEAYRVALLPFLG